MPQRANLNFKGFKFDDSPESDSTIIQIADTLTDKALYYYDATSELFKPIAIGTDGQSLIAKPAATPPFQFATPAGGRQVLTANRTYFISPTGSNSNDGLTAATPFLTPQKFADVVGTLDRGIFSVTGQFANGTYSFGSNFLSPKDGVGDGDIVYLGNADNPENVTFTGTNADGFIQAFGLSKWQIFQGIKFTNTNNGHVFNAQFGSKVQYKNCDFGAVGSGWHIVSANGAIVSNGNAPSKITGSSSGFLLLFSAGLAEFVLATLTIQNTPTWGSAFAMVVHASQLNFYNATVMGSSTGTKAIINSAGNISNAGGGNNLPGSGGVNNSGGFIS